MKKSKYYKLVNGLYIKKSEVVGIKTEIATYPDSSGDIMVRVLVSRDGEHFFNVPFLSELYKAAAK